ncbi:MAG: hypothetical protein ACW98K_02720 [Candidatus Kariarchaeaceae archaeon]|jgi:hypothetical protein
MKPSISITALLLFLLLLHGTNSQSVQYEGTFIDADSADYEVGAVINEISGAITDAFFTYSLLDLEKINEGYYGDSITFVVFLDVSLIQPDGVVAQWNFPNAWPEKTVGTSLKSDDNEFGFDITTIESGDYLGEGPLKINHLNVTDAAGTITTYNASHFDFPSLLLMNSSRKGSIQPGISYNPELTNGESLKIDLNSTLHFGADLSLPEVYLDAELRNSSDIVVTSISHQRVNPMDGISNYQWDTKITDEGDYLLNYTVSDDLNRTWDIVTSITITSVDPTGTESTTIYTTTEADITDTQSDISLPLSINPFIIGLFVLKILKTRKLRERCENSNFFTLNQ